MSEGKQVEKVKVHDMGKIPFQKAWDIQTEVLDELREIKKARSSYDQKKQVTHHLLICEHNPVYTLGKSGKESHVLINEIERGEKGIEFFKINRGGDITFHGPGQLTVYPILDLDYFFHDVHKYVRNLEEVVIKTLEQFGISSQREDGFTGVWIDGEPKRKICAIGVHMSRWITMHGFALNVKTDLNYFKHIVPCGIDDPNKTVTNMQAESSKAVHLTKVKEAIKKSFAEVFEVELV